MCPIYFTFSIATPANGNSSEGRRSFSKAAWLHIFNFTKAACCTSFTSRFQLLLWQTAIAAKARGALVKLRGYIFLTLLKLRDEPYLFHVFNCYPGKRQYLQKPEGL